MKRGLFGVTLIVAGVVVWVIATRHHPQVIGHVDINGHCVAGPPSAAFSPCRIRYGWSTAAYDLVRISAWALIAAGVIIFAVGLRAGVPAISGIGRGVGASSESAGGVRVSSGQSTVRGFVLALGCVAFVGFVVEAVHELNYASAHPFAYGPAKVIAAVSGAGAVLSFAFVLTVFLLLRPPE